MTHGNGGRLFRFDAFELNVEREELRKDGEPVRLQHQPLRLLALLVEHAGETITRERIQQAVWGNETHVDYDQSINTCVRQVRQALGDHADEPRYVKTVPRQGYRFLAEVERVELRVSERPGNSSRHRGRAWVVAAATVLVLALGVFAATGMHRVADPHDSQSAAFIDLPAADRPIVAVLPFQDLGVEPDHVYLCDALTEELISQLGRRYARRLGVIARTSAMKYRNTDRSIDEIAEELDADFVFEGSLRSVGDRVRVTAQLIRTDDQSHVWASNYDQEMDDPVSLQVTLSRRIARGMALQLLDDDEVDRPHVDPDAYDVYLRGLDQLDKGQAAQASAAFLEAVTIDPTFARGWAGRARALMNSTDPESTAAIEEALERALSLDAELPEAHLTLALVRFYRRLDIEGAGESFRTAISLRPNYAEAHHQSAAYHSVRGDHRAAVTAVQTARRLDPLSSMVHSDVGWYYYFGDRPEEALAHCRRTLELDPGFYWAELCVQFALHELGRPDELVAYSAEVVAQRDPDAPELARIRNGGDDAVTAVWEWRIRKAGEAIERGIVSPAGRAQLWMALGERERAMHDLERAFEMRSGWILPFLPVHPLFDPLREDPRFTDLVARVTGSNARAVAQR